MLVSLAVVQEFAVLARFPAGFRLGSGCHDGQPDDLTTRPSRSHRPRASRATVRTASRWRRRARPHFPSTWGKVARNAACPCGSGKQYERYHGRVR
ncbi:MAG: SEC-C metal-binding domain-containing protein [Rhodospirillales bacterium]